MSVMSRRERLKATLKGASVDRPPVSFYEINGLDEKIDSDDSFNIYSHPSWRPLIELAREKTDRMVMRGAPFKPRQPDPIESVTETETFIENGSLITIRRVQAGGRVLTCRTRRDPDVNTVWTEEHLLKDKDDLRAFLDIPPPEPDGTVDPGPVLQAEAALGDTGIVMINTSDPLCRAASLFDLGEYTVVAMTEPELFRRLLQRFASVILPRIEEAAQVVSGRLWRIVGPEYAAPPYLPPRLFREYVCRYVEPMIAAIQRYGGYARIHSHGRLKDILDDIVAMNPDGLDPIEPPPQGDVQLSYVRRRYGDRIVLFGNLEVSDIETMPTDRFAEMVRRALSEGTEGEGRGFVLMPSACPYGRVLPELTLRNYEKIIEIVER